MDKQDVIRMLTWGRDDRATLSYRLRQLQREAIDAGERDLAAAWGVAAAHAEALELRGTGPQGVITDEGRAWLEEHGLRAATDAPEEPEPAPGSAGGDVFCPELARLTARAEVAEGRVARLSEQREGHRLRLARGVNRDALRQLSDAWGAWHAWANANSDPEHLLGWGNRLCEMAAVVLSNLGYHNDRALAAAEEVRDE